MEQGGSGSSNTYDLPRITSDASPSSAVQTDSDALTYQALLSDLQRYVPRSTGSAPPPSSVTSVTYAFPPAGIISTTTSGSRETRTKVQQELFEYGNAIGSYIQSFEEAHSNQVQVLKDQLEDRTNPAKNAAVVQLGKAMQNLGNNLRGVQEVPSAIADAHEALANSYIEIGKNLALVPAAQDTDALLKAINVYNASAGTFAQNFAALATRFVENDISFGQTDPGVVFQFSYQNASVQ